VVENIIAAMQAIAAEKESQVTETIEVPTDKHRSLIGRGGDIKKELESKFKVTIDIPRQGSGQTSVKISGLPADVENAKTHISEITKQEEGEEVRVPRSYHHAVSDNGQFFRKLRADHKVTVDHAGHQVPPRPSAPTPATNGGALPLITDDQETAAGAHSWHTVSVIPPDLEGEIPWVFRGNPASVAKAKAALAAALEQVKKNTTTGYLVLPDPRTYRFVIGQGGSKVNSIRKQSGCKITVPKSDQPSGEPIEICGSASGVEQAKDLILEAVKEGIVGQRS
jgi:polyribonucleotide nucleotidyltransferase